MKKIAALVALVIGSSAQAAEFVQNGNFTTVRGGPGLIRAGGGHSATGWTTAGYNFVENNASATTGIMLWNATNGGTNTWDGYAPNHADNFVALDGDSNVQPITQTINGLVVGRTYTLSFDYAFGQQKGFTGDTTQHITASFGGGSVFQSADFIVPSKTFSGWQTETLFVTASSASEVLSFLAYGNKPLPPFSLLTNVSLTGVPEPVSWGMMILGLGFVGAFTRRRERVLASA